MRMKRIVALVPLFFPSLAAADPIFIEDGATHEVNSPTNATYGVQNGTLNILSGAEITYVNALGDGVSISMSGGQVREGIDVIQGSLNISGGQSRGYDSSVYGGDGVSVFQSTAKITGGTFTGGNGGSQAGSGVVSSAGTADSKPVVSTLDINGGTFIGGTGAGGYYGGSTGYSLVSLGHTTVAGGHFLSPIAINAAYGGETDFLGTNLTYQDNILSGTLLNGDPIDVRVYSASSVATVNDSGTEVRFLSPNAVPEPDTAWIFGLLAIVGLARRRS